MSLISFSVVSTAFLFFRLGQVLDNIINDCTVECDDEFSVETVGMMRKILQIMMEIEAQKMKMIVVMGTLFTLTKI